MWWVSLLNLYLYPTTLGVLIEPFKDGFSHAINLTSDLINFRTPLFEASMTRGNDCGAQAFSTINILH